MNPVHYSSKTGAWATPQDFFDALNAEFNFTLDVCATPENAKCPIYFSPEHDGLAQPWFEACQFVHDARLTVPALSSPQTSASETVSRLNAGRATANGLAFGWRYDALILSSDNVSSTRSEDIGSPQEGASGSGSTVASSTTISAADEGYRSSGVSTTGTNASNDGTTLALTAAPSAQTSSKITSFRWYTTDAPGPSLETSYLPAQPVTTLRTTVTPETGSAPVTTNSLVAFGNFPYGRGIGKWCRKAAEESLKGLTVVALLPARPDTAYFHDWVFPYAELRWVRGRLKFGGAKNSAPFPSVIAVYRGKK